MESPITEVTTTDLEKNLRKLGRRAFLVSVCFKIFAIGVALFYAALIVLSAADIADFSLSKSSGFSLLLQIPRGICFFLLFWLLAALFKNISNGSPVFSRKQTTRTRVAAWSMALYLFIDSFVDPFSVSLLTPDGPLAVYDNVEAAVNINLAVVILVILLFAFSSIFKYGELLQSVSDDTI